MNLSKNLISVQKDLAEPLRRRLSPTSISDVEVIETIDSTNSSLMQRSFLGHPRPGALLWALTQTSGRGRRGRVWQSSSHQALTFSLSFEAEVRQHSKLSSLSPAAGLKLAMTLSQIVPGVKVKWPNDLWRNGRKIAGILLEATQHGQIQRVVIGIGINLFWPEEEPLPSFNLATTSSTTPQTPGGLFDQEVSTQTKLDIVSACAQTIAALHLDAHKLSTDSAEWFKTWPAFDALNGQKVNLFQDQTLIASGVNAGVDQDGAFLLGALNDTHEGIEPKVLPARPQRFEIGEVSLRSVA